MLHRIPLKNSDRHAILDEQVYAILRQDEYLRTMNFFANLRLHSSGCVVFQKTFKRSAPEKGYRTVTIYLHKLVAEKYLAHQRTGTAKLVGCLNGDKCDCRLENLEYRTRSVASRKRKSSSKVGYTGVYEENGRFRAVISLNRRSIHIGMFDTPEQAALAYNAKSYELFGSDGKQNVIRPSRPTTEERTRPQHERTDFLDHNSYARGESASTR